MSARLGFGAQALLLGLLYLFLYAPIVYIIYVSFQNDSIWPFPPDFTLAHFEASWNSATTRRASGTA